MSAQSLLDDPAALAPPAHPIRARPDRPAALMAEYLDLVEVPPLCCCGFLTPPPVLTAPHPFQFFHENADAEPGAKHQKLNFSVSFYLKY